MLRSAVRRAALAAPAAALGWSSASAEPSKPTRTTRVLVTGFHDWRELDGNVWRCRDNPSCRLLLGAPCPLPPVKRAGPLVAALAGANFHVTFHTLPVIWGAASAIDYSDYDVIVHCGLGVYDNRETILLECGAWNERKGTDAVGRQLAGQSLEAGAPQRINTPRMLANTTAVVASAIGHTLAGGHHLRLAEARPENTYLCNETHHRALKALDGGPRAAYFVHLPYAAEDDPEHRRLAASVGELLRRLVEVSMANS